MFEKKELDRKEKPKEKVQVKIVLPNVKAYKKYSDDFKAVSEKTGGNMSVKMV